MWKKQKKDFLGVDIDKNSDADVIADVFKTNLPFKDNVFSEIWCHHVLEHTSEPINLLNEIWRVSKPNALIEIHTPHFTNKNLWDHLEHKRPYSCRTFIGFCKRTKKFEFLESKIHIVFHDAPFKSIKSKLVKPFIYILETFINEFKNFYEYFPLLPSKEVSFKLKVIK